MAEAFYNQLDAQSKLDNTICMYERVPMYIKCPAELILSDRVKAISLLDSSELILKYTDDAFSYSPSELGYFQTESEATYLTRASARANVEGLTIRSIAQPINHDDFRSSRMYNCILGLHPKFEDAIKELSFKKLSVAFHRHACVKRIDRKSCLVEFRGRTVAVFRIDQNKLTMFMSTDKLAKHILKSTGLLKYATL